MAKSGSKQERILIGKAWNSTLNVYKYPNKKKPQKKATGITSTPAVKKRTPIKQRSTKRAAQERQYSSKDRPEYLAAHPVCEIQVAGCTYEATEVHHKKGRIGTLLNDKSYFCAACRNCHDWAENNPKEAKEKGVSISRLKK